MSNKQLSKGGERKHRKILRDNIFGITKPALRRVLRRAGVKRISSLVYEQMRGLLKSWLETIVKDMVIIMEYARRKTISIKDLEEALELHNIYLAAGINENAKKTASLQSCNSRGKGGSSTKKTEGEDDKKHKAHRFKPGTVAKREVYKQQKNSDCLAIPKQNFQRLVREIAQDYHDDTRFSSEVFDLLQLAAEDYLINLSKNALRCCLHADRETVQAKDFQLVKAILEV